MNIHQTENDVLEREGWLYQLEIVIHLKKKDSVG